MVLVPEGDPCHNQMHTIYMQKPSKAATTRTHFFFLLAEVLQLLLLPIHTYRKEKQIEELRCAHRYYYFPFDAAIHIMVVLTRKLKSTTGG